MVAGASPLKSRDVMEGGPGSDVFLRLLRRRVVGHITRGTGFMLRTREPIWSRSCDAVNSIVMSVPVRSHCDGCFRET